MSRIFGAIRQNGYVVRDIEAALKHWTTVLGVGPFFYLERVKIDDFRYRGQPSTANPWPAPTSARTAIRRASPLTSSIRAHNMLIEIEHPAGRVEMVGNPIKLSRVDEIYQAPPALGQHTSEVLKQVLGLSARDVAELREAGIV